MTADGSREILTLEAVATNLRITPQQTYKWAQEKRNRIWSSR